MGGSVSVNSRNLVIVTLVLAAIIYFATQLSPSGVSPVIGMIKMTKNWKDVDLKSQSFPVVDSANVNIVKDQTVDVQVKQLKCLLEWYQS